MGSTPGNTGRRSAIVNIKGVDYTVHELLIDDYGEIENFIKTKYVRLYRESAAGLDPDEIHKRVMEILKTDISAEELQEQMDSTDCQLFVGYLAMRGSGITLEASRQILDADALNLVSEAVNAMGDDNDGNPTQANQEISLDGGP